MEAGMGEGQALDAQVKVEETPPDQIPAEGSPEAEAAAAALRETNRADAQARVVGIENRIAKLKEHIVGFEQSLEQAKAELEAI